MPMFQVGELAITQNSVWQENDGQLVHVVEINPNSHSGDTSAYAIRRFDGLPFEAVKDLGTGIPRFLADEVVGCAEHQLPPGDYAEIRAALVRIAELNQLAGAFA
jgi:hypothetical protein